MIGDDIALSRRLADAVRQHRELELVTQELSITTFRFVPRDLQEGARTEQTASYLDRLNRELLDRLQRGGALFVSNAVIRGSYVLRACIVNFHTTLADVQAVPGIVAELGQAVDRDLRPRPQV
jgi:glutamate/tyrosine decarboxylase-like PLP-dependent enzyme